MSKVLTTADLISVIKRRMLCPLDQITFEESDFIDMLNEEMSSSMMPFIKGVDQEYLVYYTDFAISGTSYTIPYRAVGGKLRYICLVDGSGNVIPSTRIDIENLVNFQGANHMSFYIENDTIKMTSTITGAAYVRMYYYLQPSNLVAASRVATISSINTSTGDITVDAVPSIITSSTLVDFIQAKAPNKILDYDVTVVSTNPTTLIINVAAADLPSSLAVGDYVCLAQETPVPNIPCELHPFLAQMVAVAGLEALGDVQNYQIANAKLSKMEQNLLHLLKKRTDGNIQKFNNFNNPLSQLSTSRRRSGYWS